MAYMKCELCGSNEFAPRENGIIQCSTCKTRYALDAQGQMTSKGVNPVGDRDLVINAGVLENYIGTNPRVVIPEGVTEVAPWAFAASKVTEVVFPKTLERIGERAFSDCGSLQKVTFGCTLRRIDSKAFWHCESLENVIFPSSLVEIGESAFLCCSSLKSATFNAGLKKIGDYAFYRCGLSSEIKLPSNLESVGLCSFYGNAGLTEVIVPLSCKEFTGNGEKEKAFYPTGEFKYRFENRTLSAEFVERFHSVVMTVPEIGTFSFVVPAGTRAFSEVLTLSPSVNAVIEGALTGNAESDRARAKRDEEAARIGWEKKGYCLSCGGTLKKSFFGKVKCECCGQEKGKLAVIA